jgi:hypothetical protein
VATLPPVRRLHRQGLRRPSRAAHRARQERVPGLERLLGRELRERALEMYAFVGDVMTFYQDNLARESRLVTATQRKNVIALAKMLGYRLHGAQAATAEVLPLARAAERRPSRPARSSARRRSPSRCASSSSRRRRHPGRRRSSARPARGELEDAHAALRRARARRPRRASSTSRRTSTTRRSSRRRNGCVHRGRQLPRLEPNDRHFVVAVDQNDRATLRFGNGVSGAAHGHRAGHLQDGRRRAATSTPSARRHRGRLHRRHGHPVQVSVTEPRPASGGADRQTVASAKLLAPESLRTLTRTVTREDFEINARRSPAWPGR